jgi:hypothetical protein
LPDPLRLPPLPSRPRPVRRRRQARPVPLHPLFKTAWAVMVSVSTVAVWVLNNCDPGGRIQPLWDALGALVAPAPPAAPAGSDGKPLGQSAETQ